jgi:Protein of unknown function (DUF3300)
MKRVRIFKLMLNLFLVFLIALPPWVIAQGAQGTEGSKPFKQEELDQLLAPIALYPDSLLTQVLMASTYPLEAVQADRWVKQNKDLKGDALTTALEKQQWDPSVKSLVNFPQVLAMMSEKLDWTQKLGDAFLAQQGDVMDTVQNLRAKAQEQGNLKTTKEQKVIVQEKVIIIEPASPQVVYVPTYNPVVVYGPWWYPAYPPYYYYPPGYVAGAALFSFGVGVAVGVAWGYAWGHCSWGRPGYHSVNVNINQNININRNINRNVYTKQYQGGRGTWQHDSSHRKGVAYRDQETAQKFNRTSTREATQARESFRGRAEQGRQDLSRGGGDRASGPTGDRGNFERGGRDSAFGGVDRGSNTKTQSNRGKASRESMSSRGGGRGSTGSRSGGGRGGRR